MKIRDFDFLEKKYARIAENIFNDKEKNLMTATEVLDFTRELEKIG
jgi:hypothetical protein